MTVSAFVDLTFLATLVAASIRVSSPLAEVTIQTLPAPVAMPPSESAGPAGMTACAAPVSALTRTTLLSPQLGIHKLPKPTAKPEHGL